MSSHQPSTTNRLARETSPYLLQHAHNPVDWYPWGPEALERARRENKPILVSIGYSACHWCHVMERESFEDARIAALMNEHFVCIKVDREERPDLDHIYMSAVQMLTGHGGWPLTVFLTPDGAPFYGGTYFPPVDRHGMPGFPRVLAGVAEAYRAKPDQIRESVQQLRDGLTRAEHQQPTGDALDPDLPVAAARSLVRHCDREHGGLGGAPKFPNSLVFSLFLRAWHATGDGELRDLTLETLRRMAAGGIYDQLGGGFHRYSVDAHWLVPHFEKMLYDNALLVRLYLEAYQATGGDSECRRVVEETLGYVRREMTHPDGGFYAAQDADSEGEEGKYFVWTRAEVMEELGSDHGEIVCRFFDVSDAGNFEHRNILHRTLDFEQMGRLFARPAAEIATIVAEGRARLLERRSHRVPPARDDKILTSWNALMIGAFAEAYKVLGDAAYRAAAERAVAFIYRHLVRDGRLLRTFKDGEAKLNAYLDDYAFLLNALLDLYEGTFDIDLVTRASDLAEALLTHFEDQEHGGFFFTSADHETLVHRPKPAFDGSIPSGNAAAALGLLRLFSYRNEPRFLAAAERTLRHFAHGMRTQPFGLAHMLAAADLYLRKPREIVVVGRADDAGTRALIERIHHAYVPNKTLIVTDPHASERLPPADGQAAARRPPHGLRVPRLRVLASRHHLGSRGAAARGTCGVSGQPASVDSVLRERVAAAHNQRTDELRAQADAATRRLTERLAVAATLRLVLEGADGGEWYLVLRDGRMEVTSASNEAPLVTIYQSAESWARLLAAGKGFLAAGGGPELDAGRAARLQTIAGAIEFRLTEVDDGGPVTVVMQLGGGHERLTPTTTLTLRAADAQRLRTGELQPPQAMMQGLVQIGGDASLAMQVGVALFM